VVRFGVQPAHARDVVGKSRHARPGRRLPGTSHVQRRILQRRHTSKCLERNDSQWPTIHRLHHSRPQPTRGGPDYLGIPMATCESRTKGTFLRTGPRCWTSQTVLSAYEVTPRLSVRCCYHTPLRGKGSKPAISSGQSNLGLDGLQRVPWSSPHPLPGRGDVVVVSACQAQNTARGRCQGGTPIRWEDWRG
jgi:hypothetical protein